ncbi:CALCRL.2 family protein [Megaselia abdita]
MLKIFVRVFRFSGKYQTKKNTFFQRLCVIWHIVIYYFMLSNYFWVFCEGLHLHLALVVVFVKDTIAIRWFLVIGWIFPIFYVGLYGIFLFYLSPVDPKCGIENEDAIWILSVPVCMSLLASFVFLVNVLRVLLSKIQPQSTQPPPIGIRRAVRATIILIPLFGLQHTLIPFRPSINEPYEKYYQMMSVFLVSLQGLFVSSLYCFANQDVIFAFHVFLNRAMPNLVPPVPSSVYTGTGPLGTNTPSHAEIPL